MNGAYWIKPVTTTYAPTALVSWSTAVRDVPGSRCANLCSQTLGKIVVMGSRFRRGRWSDPCREAFVDPAAAHDWLEQWCHPRQRTYVVSPCVSDSLVLSGWFHRITERGIIWDMGEPGENDPPGPTHNADPYKLQTMILRGNPDVLRYSVGGAGVCWLSGRQYFELPDSQLATAVRFVSPDCNGCMGTGTGRVWCVDCVAALWLHAMRSLSDWWRVVGGGPWGYTAGGLALNFFRSRLIPKSCLAHTNKYAKRIESHAIHGGRASTFYLGEILPAGVAPYMVDHLPPIPTPGHCEGPVSLYDVRSMYPHLLGDKPYPVRLLDVWEQPSIPWVRDVLKSSCVIARVDLDAREPEYPCRHKDGIIYPVGTFSATLCGPELARAIDRGEVQQIRVALSYEQGRPFKRMATDLLQMRLDARKNNNDGWEQFIKMLSNAFSGKLAQRKGQWERRVDAFAEMPWGEWVGWDDRTGKASRWRAMADLVWEYCLDDASGRPMGAAYAYLCAYGRDKMRAARASLEPRSVVSQDTDGIWVLDSSLQSAGYTNLELGNSPGDFCHKHTSAYARFFSPKHYVTDKGWTLSGYHDAEVIRWGEAIRDHQSLNPILGSPRIPPELLTVRTRETPMVSARAAGMMDHAGWLHPLTVRAGRLIAPLVPSATEPLASANSLFDPVRL